MKKYTKRFKDTLRNWRVAKNWAAVLILLGNAAHMLITHGSWQIVLTAASTALLIITIGETLYYLGMSWVETAESIQNKES